MKQMKLLGLAAIAALGLMAFVGAGTASATTLFTDSAKTIKYPAGTTMHLTLKSGTSLIVTDTSTTPILTCASGTIHGSTTNETGAAVGISVGIKVGGNCNQTLDTLSTGNLSVTWTSGSNGTVTESESSMTLQTFGVSCTYGTGTGTTLGTITGGSEPDLAVNAVLSKTAGSFLCPSTTYFIGTFIVTSPHALFVGS